MQRIWNRFNHAYSSRGSCVALLSVLAIVLFASAANAVAPAPIVVSQTTQYAALPSSSGPFAGEEPVGSSWAVNSKGVAVVSGTYGNNIYEYAPPTYAATVAGPLGNASGVAIDNNGFLYVSVQYGNSIVKYPMNSDGTYTWTVDPTSTGNTPPTCAGDTKAPDTAGACLITPLTVSGLGYFGVTSMAFDSNNVLYFSTDDQGSNQWSIFQCKNNCAYPASGATAVDPTLIYAEPVTPSASVATQGQLWIGGMAFDPWGDLFFTDGAVWGSAPCASGCSTGPGTYVSNLNELPVVTSAIHATKFAAAPSVILTETNAAPIGAYNDAIVGVSISKSGNVYISLVNSGIYGLTSNGSLDGAQNGTATVSSSSLYGISNQGTKLLATDNNGNFYALANTGNLDFVYTGPVRFPGPEVVGTPENVNVLVADNSELCAGSSLAASGDSTVTANPTTGTSCSNMSMGPGSFTPATLTYTPAVTGFVPGTLTITDTTSSASTTQTVASSGVAVTISQGTFGHKILAGGAWGGSSPGGTSAAVTSATSAHPGVFVVGSSYGNDIEEFSSLSGNLTGTVVSDGPLNGGGGVAIDSHGYLYMSSEYGNSIYKIPMNAAGSASAYGPWTTDPSASGNTTPTCTGDGNTPDTAGICVIATNYQGSSLTAGTAALAFDANNNLFITTGNNNATNAYSVFECGPTCLYSAADAVLLYAEPVSATATPQLNLGSITVDPSGNVFFTDSMISPLASEYSLYSDLYELPYNSGTSSYAATPTLLETLSPVCASLSGCTYSTAINTVAVDANGDVFFGGPNDGSGHIAGLWELTNNSGTLSSIPIAVSPEAPKIIVPDGTGNFYFVGYNGGDSGGYLSLGSVAVTPAAQTSAPSTVTNVWAIDNYASCQAGQGNLSFTEAASDGFSAVETAGSNCTTIPLGKSSSFPVSVTFTPTASASGTVTTTITATNSNTGDTGTANVSGLAATAQPITGFSGITSPVVYGAASSYTLTANTGAAGNAPVFTVDATVGTPSIASITGSTLTITGVGNFAIDVNEAGGLVSGTTYANGYLQVPITVDQAPQTIVYSGPTTTAYTTTAIDLSTDVTGGASGNPVVLALVSGPATLSGSTLTITGVGTIDLTADQQGNADYSAAPELPISITVTQAPQTIIISAAPASPTYPATSTITATGGASGNAVTLAITSGSSIATLSGTTLTPTGTAFGAVVVTANQAGNTNYAAAAPAPVTVTFASVGTVATPTISPATNSTLTIGSTGDSITIADTTASAVISYTTDGSNPLTSTTAKVYSAPFTLPTAGNITVMAAATLLGDTPSATASSTYTVVTLAPTFTVTATPATATVTSSTPGVITITVAPNATFTSSITFACTGAPANVTCAFSPNPLTAGHTTTTLTVTKSATAALHNGPNPFLPGGVTFALALGFLGWKKRRGILLLAVLLASVVCLTQLTACGSNNGTTTAMSVTATGGGVTQTLPVTITVK